MLRLQSNCLKILWTGCREDFCYALGDTNRSVSWTSVYSLIRRTCPVGDGVCTHVKSRRKALLYRDLNLQPDLSLDYKPGTLTNSFGSTNIIFWPNITTRLKYRQTNICNKKNPHRFINTGGSRQRSWLACQTCNPGSGLVAGSNLGKGKTLSWS